VLRRSGKGGDWKTKREDGVRSNRRGSAISREKGGRVTRTAPNLLARTLKTDETVKCTTGEPTKRTEKEDEQGDIPKKPELTTSWRAERRWERVKHYFETRPTA